MGQVIYGLDFKRTNQNAERAFWKGRELAPIEQMAIDIMNQAFPYIEYGVMNTPTPESLAGLAEYVAPEKDGA